MTLTPSRSRVVRLEAADVDRIAEVLERGFDGSDAQASDERAADAHMVLLDALDRGQHRRFLVWPDPSSPQAVLYAASSGTLVPAGAPDGAPALTPAAERLGWRVLVGDMPLGSALVAELPSGLFSRRVRAREQRLMGARRGADVPSSTHADAVRLAARDDLDALVAFACNLHVEDEMGPPISKAARVAVRSRLRDSVSRDATYVLDLGDGPLAKADLSLHSQRRGAQIAGVYVDERARNRGLGTALVAEVLRRLFAEGAPAATLHVRADNAPAIAAYERAGLIDLGPWMLALR